MKRLIFTLTVVSSLVILTGCSGSGIGGALSDTVGAITGKVNAGTDVSGRTSPLSSQLQSLTLRTPVEAKAGLVQEVRGFWVYWVAANEPTWQ